MVKKEIEDKAVVWMEKRVKMPVKYLITDTKSELVFYSFVPVITKEIVKRVLNNIKCIHSVSNTFTKDHKEKFHVTFSNFTFMDYTKDELEKTILFKKEYNEMKLNGTIKVTAEKVTFLRFNKLLPDLSVLNMGNLSRITGKDYKYEIKYKKKRKKSIAVINV
jgi:hypothetical protein